MGFIYPILKSRPAPDWLNSGRIPTLDGLRGVAIGLVILAHAGGSADWKFAQAGQPLSYGGQIGVDLFFIISGFLITTLFLREWEQTGRVDLRSFYLRRCLRILPAAYAYLIFVACLCALGICQVPTEQWVATLCYVMNFFSNPSNSILHFWSLSIEEQFYLLWPPLFVALMARRKGMNVEIAAASSLAVALVGRVAILAFWPDDYGASRSWTPTRIDGIAAGCLLALVARQNDGVGRLDRFSRWWPALIFGCLVLQIGGRRLSPYVAAIVPTIEVAGLAAILWTIARVAPDWFDKGPLARLGVLSYSFYIWQEPFLVPDHPRWWSSWPQNLLPTFGFAIASYFLIERPFLRLKGRISHRQEPAHHAAEVKSR